ncbi:uncharacterized protein MAM_07169 [Metarhizium album ARSEF 1941]|uniref:Uncharacterized protein n=1 Tax=Metarhizium album (strain ARSEF 1941) TaxID=1081103 RepID=A0A0B2WN76_METAS|nr:uncharacterized protein MAM_07169 [Metarhizium album ARSEF 1941]KHN94942.1 hypothetical protein MAM_07169 [Metarhizium album ARSEF 1941]
MRSMLIATSLWAAAAITSLASASSCSECNFVLNRDSQKRSAKNYIDMWNGDLGLEHETFTPGVVLHQDRLPGTNGSVDLAVRSSADFVKFMRLARSGWHHYGFVVHATALDLYSIVIRWALNATVGPRDKMLIPVAKPEGTHITYNGTDWLHLDECTGKIKQVDSAQDYITALHEQGVATLKI